MRYTNATIDHLDEPLKALLEQAVQENKGIFLYGITGVGKTHFMQAIANIKRAKVENFVKMLVEFRYALQKGVYFDKLKELCNQDYLLIDDIGAEKTSDFVVEFLYLVINERYENGKRTVLTSNLTLDGFKERYGDRILSRIGEMCIIHEMQGTSRRL